MSVSHSCPKHPNAKKGRLYLVEGSVADCKYHGRRLPTVQTQVIPSDEK